MNRVIHVDHKNNPAGDILVYDKSVLPASKISRHYADVPAVLHIEVDIKLSWKIGLKPAI